MRKYHQLLLVLVSSFSVIILLIYKSENTRLKDVLSAVNFFSRNDAAVLRQVEIATETDDAQIDFMRPLPVWQVIGENFHAYASYWHRNELLASGEVLTLVTGKSGAVVNFRCSAYYDADNRVVQGKFRFQRLQLETDSTNIPSTNYNFFCRLKGDLVVPDRIIFSDLSASNMVEYKLRLRHIMKVNKIEPPSTKLAICVDLVSFNMSTAFGRDESYLLQFFYHHQVLGIKYFIVYRSDDLPTAVLQKVLRHKGINLQLLPFNFPFAAENNTESLRNIIETDCLLRCMYLAKQAILLAPNEFFLPNAKLSSEHSMIHSLHHYSAEIKRFELPTFAVCINQSSKLLANNSLYDPELAAPHRTFIYRPHVPISAPESTSTSSVTMSLSTALAHRYTTCVRVGKDGLHNWQNSLRQDFMQNINEVNAEVIGLIS